MVTHPQRLRRYFPGSARGSTGRAQFMDQGPGQVVAPLQDVALANGTGTSTTTVSRGYADVVNGQHIVAYHTGAGQNPGAPAVCGQIPAQQAGASATPAP